jgi:hypothetical protein
MPAWPSVWDHPIDIDRHRLKTQQAEGWHEAGPLRVRRLKID